MYPGIRPKQAYSHFYSSGYFLSKGTLLSHRVGLSRACKFSFKGFSASFPPHCKPQRVQIFKILLLLKESVVYQDSGFRSECSGEILGLLKCFILAFYPYHFHFLPDFPYFHVFFLIKKMSIVLQDFKEINSS